MNIEQSITKLRRLVADKRLVEARNLSLDLTQKYSDHIDVWKARSDLHFMFGEYDSFAQCGQRILQLSSTMPFDSTLIKTYSVLGRMYFNIARVTDALFTYERLIAITPNDAQAQFSVALCYLLLGDFRRGWPQYEWRLKTPSMAVPPTGKLRWEGESLENKVIVIISEQGYGDTLQFVRYLPDVKARGGTVILGCKPELRRLLAGCAGIDQIVCVGEIVPPYDVETPLLSLPGIFKTSLETIPNQVPYLSVPPDAGQKAASVVTASSKKFRVGLVWGGNINRSLRLKQLLPLLGILQIHFFSLQKGPAVQEIKSFPAGKITDLDPYLEDFADTAAAVQALDLVISIDTSVAHLAGALAKPVWTLIPFASEWRWMLNRDDSPWYPTMRLFRQPAPGDWASVIARVAAQLTALVQEQSTSAAGR